MDAGSPRAGAAPLQGFEIGDTVLVLIGLDRYARAEQRPELEVARESAQQYLDQAPIRNQQDRLWKLWGIHLLGGSEIALAEARNALIKAQREDGGWSQTDADPASDAYSTGQALYMLLQTGTPPDDPVSIRARDWLLNTQHADGSWLVESRVKIKAQPFFENGDPHGEHQFLSTAATCWATAALAHLLPREPPVALP